MAWPPALSSSWHNVEALTCFGSFCLSSWWSALVTCSRNFWLIQASGEGRGRSRRALPLLPLLLFSSFSFASSSLNAWHGNSGCESGASACAQVCASAPSTYSNCSYAGNGVCNFSNSYDPADTSTSFAFCGSYTCSVPSGEPVVPNIGSSLTPNSNGVIPNTFCDPSDYCDTESFSSSVGSGGSVTNGQACIPTSPTSSTSSSSSSCPSGYSLADSSGCVCSNGSSFVPASGSATNPSCNGGSSTAPTLSPVSPVTSNGTTSCPSGDATVTSGSSVSCYAIVVPPPTNSSSSGSVPSGGGGGSSFHVVSPVMSSNGQLTCQPGQSSIMGSSGSLECIASGPGTAPTSSTGSGTSPTASASSGTSYPSSISMPSLPSDSVVTTALSTIPGAEESTSESCPAPVTFTVLGSTFQIPFTYACNLASRVRPVVIGVFSLASLLLIVK